MEQGLLTQLNGRGQYLRSQENDEFSCRKFLMLWLGISYQYGKVYNSKGVSLTLICYDDCVISLVLHRQLRSYVAGYVWS